MLDGKRAGLDLPEDKRNELATLKKELSSICVQFQVCTDAYMEVFIV